MFAWTPDECIAQSVELKAHLTELSFGQIVVGVPLGPDMAEALGLLAKEVRPALVD